MNTSSLPPPKTSPVFTWPIRIYYEDTDAGGVVYHSQYLNFMERARTEWLRSLGYTQQRLREESGILFVVRHIDIDYLHPARFDQLLQLDSHVSSWQRSHFIFSQSLWLDEGDNQHNMSHANSNTPHQTRDHAPRKRRCISKAQVTIVCIDQQRFRPIAIPQDLQDALKHEH